MTFGHEAFDGARQENGGFDTRGVVTANGNVALQIQGREMEDTIASGDESFTIGRDHASATWAVRSKSMVQIKMGCIACGRGLRAIVKMCVSTVKADTRVGTGRQANW